MPITPPMQAIIADSAKNWTITEEVLAPRDFLMPISLVLSVTDTSIIFMTPMPPTSREIPATKAINPVIMFSMELICFIWSLKSSMS